MTHPRYLIGLMFFALIGTVTAATKSDQAKEKRWEEQIVPSLLVGEPVTLKAGEVEFLALAADNVSETELGGAIIIHGIGVHPAWPDIIDPLRMNLPEHGWHTLSLQMPILPNEAEGKDYIPLLPEVPARIQAGVDYFKARGVKNIVIIAHSLGGVMTNYYLAKQPDPAVRAYVSIGVSNATPGGFDAVAAYKKINIPVFDIYGSQDLEGVLATAVARANNSKHNKNFRQVKVDGANHFFSGMQEELVELVRDWLGKQAGQK